MLRGWVRPFIFFEPKTAGRGVASNRIWYRIFHFILSFIRFILLKINNVTLIFSFFPQISRVLLYCLLEWEYVGHLFTSAVDVHCPAIYTSFVDKGALSCNCFLLCVGWMDGQTDKLTFLQTSTSLYSIFAFPNSNM